MHCFKQDFLVVLFCFRPVLIGCLHHPFSRFGPDSSFNRAASSQPRGASSDLIQKTNQKKITRIYTGRWRLQTCRPACYILDWAAAHPSTPPVCTVSSGYKTLNGLKCEVAGQALRHAEWMDPANGCQQPMQGRDFSNEMAWCHSLELSRPSQSACAWSIQSRKQ